MTSRRSEPLDLAAAHPVAGFVARLRQRLDELVDPARTRPVWAMDPAELRYVLGELATATAQLESVRLQVLAEADRTGATGAEASASAAEWVAHRTRQRRVHARSDLRLAQALEHHTATAEAMATGEVNPDQARVIVRAVDRLPTAGDFAVEATQRVAAEEHLVGLAADLRREGARGPRRAGPRGRRARPGRGLRGSAARGPGGSRRPQDVADDGAHARRAVPGPVHRPGAARRDPVQGDPGAVLTHPVRRGRHRHRPPHPGASRRGVHPAPRGAARRRPAHRGRW